MTTWFAESQINYLMHVLCSFSFLCWNLLENKKVFVFCWSVFEFEHISSAWIVWVVNEMLHLKFIKKEERKIKTNKNQSFFCVTLFHNDPIIPSYWHLNLYIMVSPHSSSLLFFIIHIRAIQYNKVFVFYVWTMNIENRSHLWWQRQWWWWCLCWWWRWWY